MKHEKKALLKTAYQRVLDVTLLDVKAPLKWIDSYVAENVTGRGTASDETFYSRADYKKIIVNSRRQSRNIAFHAKLLTRYAPKLTNSDIAVFYDEVFVTIGKGKQQHHLHLSVSTTFTYQNNRWQLINLHASLPDPASNSADTFHLDEANQRLRLLEEKVAEKTAALVAKNRDLAIEAALEKVRARAMSMHRSSELIEVANTMREQLSKLGQHQLEAFVINLYTKGASTHQSWYAFRHSRKNTEQKSVTGIATQVNDSCKLMQEVVQSYFSGKRETLLVVRGRKLSDWYRVLSKAIPTIWNEIKKNPYPVNYWNLTSFSGGAMLMVTAEPPTAEAKRIQRRCTEVFDLAFRRFQDLQKAEAQAREAQIQLALERVRAKSLAMHHTSELQQIIYTVHHELLHLNISVVGGSFIVLNKDIKDELVCWGAGGTANTLEEVRIPDFNLRFCTDLITGIKQGRGFFIEEFSQQEKLQYFKKLFKQQPWSSISAKQKNETLSTLGGYTRSVVVLKHTSLFIINHHGRKFTDEENSILQRIANVFEQAYTRFLDLQKAEAQAREAEIELALERVRARTMAMQKSEELKEAATLLYKELSSLNIGNLFNCGYVLVDEKNKLQHAWMTHQDGTIRESHNMPLVGDKIMNERYAHWKKGTRLLKQKAEGKTLRSHLAFVAKANTINVSRGTSAAKLPDPVFFYSGNFPDGYLHVLSREQLCEESESILLRFTTVFEQTYTRFLDLQKAEAQAREAIIENAIEKVRSRSLAMHRSEEIMDVASLVADKLKELHVQMDACTILIFHENNTEYWIAGSEASYTHKFLTKPERMIEGSAVASDFAKYQPVGQNYTRCYNKKEKNQHWKYLFRYSDFKNIPVSRKQFILHQPVYNLSVAFSGDISLTIMRYQPIEYTEAENQLINRFAKVFAQAYTRFSDLQKAEAQTREAQIEASLEKVRSVAMGMRKAADLLDICETSYAELIKLGFTELRNTMINIHDDSEETFLNYDYSVYAGKAVTKYGYHIHPVIRNLVSKSRAAQDAFVDIGLYGTEFEEWKKFRSKSGEQDDDRLNSINHLNYYFYSIGIGSIGISTFESISEQKLNTLKRFRNVFQLAYQRFTDLTLAEAQAREAQIETALERVRARTMAMQKSEELSAVAHVLFEEFKQLNLSLGDKLSRAFVITVDEEKESFQFFITTSEGNYLPVVYPLPFKEKTNGVPLAKCWRLGEAMLINVIEGAAYKQWLKYLDSIQLYISPEIKALKKRVNHYVRFSKGFLGITANEVLEDDAVALLQRFAKVFDQTFTRFVDLQIAEASAKEAIKQAALDRIRANIASMRTVEDLDRITPIIWNELRVLGIPFVRCGIFIMDESLQQIHTFLSSPNGGHIAAYYMRFQETPHIYAMVEHWRKHAKFIERWTLSEFTLLATSLYHQGAIKDQAQYLQSIPAEGMWLHFIPFMQGMLYVGNESSLPEDAIDTLAAVADAFSTAYARYEDFNKLEQAKIQVENTLVDLKQAQKQLVQSEKMASLGELTAGIAHEIQNPLNFVNNFSEVTQELLEELRQELKHGNTDGVQDLMDDIIQNLEKINHHGKRADGIVKGMLQHSRTSSGQKELVDINVLCDEYLRLSYHGLRAKDKSFNAKFETSFDDTITKVNVMPQEMGRVILNLINNAFYAVSKKLQDGAADYVPTVRIRTQKDADKILISVQDNGMGIPEQIKDKIFQPFFTTKPTGQGTGLGLSLSYDIVKAHGGEIQINSEQGVGTIFQIILPV